MISGFRELSFVLCHVSGVLCVLSCVLLCPVSCVRCPVSYALCPASCLLCVVSCVFCEESAAHSLALYKRECPKLTLMIFDVDTNCVHPRVGIRQQMPNIRHNFERMLIILICGLLVITCTKIAPTIALGGPDSIAIQPHPTPPHIKKKREVLNTPKMCGNTIRNVSGPGFAESGLTKLQKT